MLTKERIEEIRDKIANLKIRCSSISSIMAYPNKNEMPKGAMTVVETLVDEIVYDFIDEVTTKYMEKGHAVEDASIGLYNRVFFKNYKKAELPNENEFLKTESCDVDDEDDDKILDIKSPWTKKTFPKTKRKAEAEAKKSGYDWQLQGYMSIYKRKNGEVAYCFSDTPEELCQWEEQSLHITNNDIVPEELLITRVEYTFDTVKEAQIFARVKLCRAHGLKYFEEILKDHGINY